MFWNGSLSKALTDAKGTQHLIFLATGERLDREEERMTIKSLEKWEGAAKAGRVALVPSHDVPIPLGKSVDSSRDEAGHSLIDFALDADDPLARKVYRMFESAEEPKPQVSIGAEHCKKEKTFDAALGKSITEIVDIDVDAGLHCALTFPGRAVYRDAGLVQALTKAFKGDAAELAKRGWPEDAIAKATSPGGEYTPPTFAQRHTRDEFADELPGLLDTLRLCIEDIVSPWSGGDKPALLATTFREFAATVGLEIADAGGLAASGDPALAKADAVAAPSEPQVPVPTTTIITEPDAPALKAVAALQEIVVKHIAKVEGEFEALHKAKVADESLEKATPAVPAAPVVPDTDPASAPHTGCQVDSAADNKANARKATEDRVDGLRKAIAAEHNPGRRGHLQQEHAGLLAKLSRMP